jgi:hypothetical protein
MTKFPKLKNDILQITKILLAFSVLGAICGALYGISMITASESAPQVAAYAAVSLAWAVIPYCFSRSAIALLNLVLTSLELRLREQAAK